MVWTIIVFVIILGVLVLAHEMGHFYFARKFGAKVEEAGFGFPPRLCGWVKQNGQRKFFWGRGEKKSDEPIYSLNWIPIGGFVKIKGEDGEAKEDKDSFASRKPWQKATILAAGVSLNVALTLVCLITVFLLGAPQALDKAAPGVRVADEKIQILSVLPDSPAKKAGLQMGDVVVSIDNKTFPEVTDVQNYLSAKPGEKVALTVRRANEEKNFELIPETVAGVARPAIGISLAKTGIVSYPWYQAIWNGVKATFFMFINIIVAFAMIIKNAVIGQPLGVEVAGPVGIAVLTGQMARLGFVYILQFTALLSMNLAIINALPFPALDGGRLLFLAVEKIRRRPVSQKVEQIAHTIGFFLLILLIAIVTGKDIWKNLGK